MQATTYKDDLGKDVVVGEIPAEHLERAKAAREHLLEEVSHYDDGLVELILEDAEIPVDRLKQAIRKATLEIAFTPVLCGSSFKNQRRAAAARRRPRVPAVPARRAARRGHRPEDRGDRRPQRRRLRAVRGTGLQDHVRPVRRQAHLLPRLLGPARGRVEGAERLHRQVRARRPDPDDARQRPRGRPARSTPATSPPPSASSRSSPATRCASRTRPSSSSRSTSPSPSSRSPSSRRRSPTRRRCRSRWAAWPRRTRPSACRPTRRPARPRSPAWASCTSRSSSTACAASSTSRPTSASRRSPTARPCAARPRRSRASSSARPAARASTASSTSTMEPAPGEGFDFVSEIKGGSIPSEFIPAVEKGCEEAMGTGVKAGYPMVDVTRATSSTASTTTRTRRRSPSRSPARWPSRRPPSAPSRSCWSPSSRSRS